MAANPGPAARTLTITAGCQTFTVNQDGQQTTSTNGPMITTLSPASAAAGSAAFTLTVNGTNFISGSTVTFNGAARTTTFVSSTKLTSAVHASDVEAAGSPLVVVNNPTLNTLLARGSGGTAFASDLGGGLDLRITKQFSVRLVELLGHDV